MEREGIREEMKVKEGVLAPVQLVEGVRKMEWDGDGDGAAWIKWRWWW